MKPEISAAASSTTIMKSANCPSSMTNKVRRRFSGMVFGPYSVKRFCASAVVSPVAEDSRSRNASSASVLCQTTDRNLLTCKHINESGSHYGDQQGLDPTA